MEGHVNVQTAGKRGHLHNWRAEQNRKGPREAANYFQENQVIHLLSYCAWMRRYYYFVDQLNGSQMAE
jgi:hypothetical protein